MNEHELWNELGNLYFMSGAYDQAIVAYSRSIQMDDAYGKPYSNLALVYVHQGKYDQAVRFFRRSLDLLSDDKEKAVSWNRLGKVYRQIKDYQQAVIAFQQADELDPESREDNDEPSKMLYASADLAAFMQKYAASLPDLKEAAAAGFDQSPVEPAPEMVEPASEMVEPASEMIEPAPEMVEPASEMIEPEPEMVEPASEMMEPEPEIIEAEPVSEELTEAVIIMDPSTSELEIPIEAEASSLTSWLDIDLDDDMDASQTFSGETDLDLFSTMTESPEVPVVVMEEAPLDQTPQPSEHGVPEEALIPLPVDSLNWQQAPAQAYSYPTARADFSEAEQLVTDYGHEVAVDVEELPAAPVLPIENYGVETTQTFGEPVQIEAEEKASTIASREALDLEKEITKYKRVVQINERNASAWDALGTLYKSAGLYKESIQAHQQAISIDPNKPSYHHHLGLAFGGAGRDEDAIASFQRVTELDPDHYLAHASLGGYYRKLGLEELAQKHIGKAMRNIYDSENEYNRACLDAICGNVDQAIDLLRVALEKKQTYVEWIIHDPDLDFIREDARFKQLISTYTN